MVHLQPIPSQPRFSLACITNMEALAFLLFFSFRWGKSLPQIPNSINETSPHQLLYQQINSCIPPRLCPNSLQIHKNSITSAAKQTFQLHLVKYGEIVRGQQQLMVLIGFSAEKSRQRIPQRQHIHQGEEREWASQSGVNCRRQLKLPESGEFWESSEEIMARSTFASQLLQNYLHQLNILHLLM